MDKKGFYGIDPIRFKNIGYIGSLGPDSMAMKYYLSNLLTQNILYIAYYEPKKISEIAELLGVKTSLVEERIYYLEYTGLMDKVSSEKYLTNILIFDYSMETYEELHKLYTKYAKIICETFIPYLYKSTIENIQSQPIYVPENDLNFLFWSIVGYSFVKKYHNIVNKTVQGFAENINSIEYHYTRRNDGCANIIYVYIKKKFYLSFNEDLYTTFDHKVLNISSNDMIQTNFWQYNTHYDNRDDGWGQELQRVFNDLYDYLSNKNESDYIKNNDIKELFDLGLLRNKTGKNYVNTVVSKISEDELDKFLPSIPDLIIELNNELSSEIIKLCKNHFPEHKQNIYKSFYKSPITSGEILTRVYEQLLYKGILKSLTDNQKYTVNTIVFCDILP